MDLEKTPREVVERLLTRAAISLSDMYEARETLYYVRGEVDGEGNERKIDPLDARLNSLLICYAAIAYCRPFVESRGEGARFLTLKQIGVRLTDDQLALHNKLLLLRKKAFAHSDEELRWARLVTPKELGIVVEDHPGTGPVEVVGISSRAGYSYATDIDRRELRLLFDTVKESLVTFVANLRRRLEAE